jgi:hypothetical protein
VLVILCAKSGGSTSEAIFGASVALAHESRNARESVRLKRSIERMDVMLKDMKG